MRAKEQGFSLIELLIVIAIILIIAAIAIPNLLQARISANEASAANSVRQIGTAQAGYYNGFPTVGYAAQLPDLGGVPPCAPPTSIASCLLDNSLATAIPGSTGKSGYVFQTTGINSGAAINGSFATGATPLQLSRSGNRNFCATDDGVLRIQFGVGGPPITTKAACLAYPVAQ
jgi:prepilin-type N-terminal cleavage/methylation domain-containing protein